MVWSYEILVSALAASYFPLLAELFPTEIRYTGVAISYNVIYSLAGCVPMILSFLLRFLPTPTDIIWFFLLLALLSIFSAYKIKAIDIKAKDNSSNPPTSFPLSSPREI